jgi:hypothetical protein
MGTRSDIIVHCADDKWRRIYCHYDGYLEHNGRILFDSYTDQRHVEALVALGDLSQLAPSTEKPRGHTFAKPVKGYCVAYGRDRRDKDCAATVGDSLAAVWPETDTWTEFTYVWDDGKWWVGDPDEGTQTLIDLGDALLGKKTLTPSVKAFGGVIGQHHASTPEKPHGWTAMTRDLALPCLTMRDRALVLWNMAALA